jgi:hypothetical protein
MHKTFLKYMKHKIHENVMQYIQSNNSQLFLESLYNDLLLVRNHVENWIFNEDENLYLGDDLDDSDEINLSDTSDMHLSDMKKLIDETLKKIITEINADLSPIKAKAYVHMARIVADHYKKELETLIKEKLNSSKISESNNHFNAYLVVKHNNHPLKKICENILRKNYNAEKYLELIKNNMIKNDNFYAACLYAIDEMNNLPSKYKINEGQSINYGSDPARLHITKEIINSFANELKLKYQKYYGIIKQITDPLINNPDNLYAKPEFADGTIKSETEHNKEINRLFAKILHAKDYVYWRQELKNVFGKGKSFEEKDLQKLLKQLEEYPHINAKDKKDLHDYIISFSQKYKNERL